MTQSTINQQVADIAKQRGYIESHLDMMGLKHDPIVISCIRENLSKDYRAIDVAIAYGKHYRAQYDCVELHRSKNRA